MKKNIFNSKKLVFSVLLALLVCSASFVIYQITTSQVFNYWMKDRARTLTEYTLFLGSSSIARLPIALVSQCKPAVVYGFENGTTESIESYLRFAKIPNAKQIVLYIGENDIAQGEHYLKTVGQLDEILTELLASTDAKISVMTVKPSPRRIRFHEEFTRFNELVRNKWADEKNAARVTFIDFDTIKSPMFYVKDGVHLNSKGYALLSDMINNTCI